MYHKTFKAKPQQPAKMNWGQLQDGQCPACETRLFYSEDTMMFNCKCGFKITESRYKEITSGIASGSFQRKKPRYNASVEEKNLSELNNM